MNDIKIYYDGVYPNLCSGNLVVWIYGKKYIFPEFCMASGGDVYFEKNMEEVITEGLWSIEKWPDDFPEEYKKIVVEKINEQIPRGCCGGCV